MIPNKSSERKVDTFQLKDLKSVEADLKQIYSTKIENDLGIKLGADDLTNVNAHLSREAKNNPEEFKKIAEKVKDFKELPERINRQIRYIYGEGARLKELEALLKKVSEPEGPGLTSRNDTGFLIKAMWDNDLLNIKDFKWTELSQIEKKQDETKLDTAKRYGKYAGKALIRTFDGLNWLTRKTVTTTKEILKQTPIIKDYFQSEEAQKSEKVLREKFKIEPRDAETELVRVQNEIKKINEAKLERRQMEDRLGALKAEIFNESFAPTLIIASIARKKIEGQFKEMLASASKPTESPEKLFELKKKIGNVLSPREENGLDYTENTDIGKIAGELDVALTIRAKHELLGAIKNITSLAKLEETLKPYLTGDKETRQFLILRIKRIIHAAEVKKIKDPKFVLPVLKAFLTKIETEEIEEELKQDSWLESTRTNLVKEFGEFK